MASVFAGGQTHKGGFRADQLKLTFGGTDVAGFLVQNAQFQFSQQVTTLYEIGSSNVYLVGGRAQGTAAIGRVIGPSELAAQFINHFNDLCKPENMVFETTAGCEGPGNQSASAHYILEDAVLTAINVSVSAQDTVISEQLQFIFINLDDGKGDAAGG